MAGVTAAALAVVVLAFYAYFYRTVVRHWGAAIEPLVDRLGLAATRSVRETEAIGKLAAAGIAQALFATALVLVLGVDTGDIAGLAPQLIALGAVLGVGELAVASFLATAAVRLAMARSGGPATEAWLAQGRGGWMGQFGATTAAAPAWVATATISLYVAGEELVFRAIVIDAAAGAGAVAAVGLSVVLFMAAQAFNMPSVRAATFPIMGALVVGLVHGVLFWKTRDVTPLIAAHLTYFGGVLVLNGGMRRGAS